MDILLDEKLEVARGIEAEVSLVLHRLCGMDDFDLCVIFANTLNNAISACRSSDGERVIRVSGEQQWRRNTMVRLLFRGDFFLLAERGALHG